MKALEAVGLTKHFGKIEIIKGIDISVEKGEIVGFIGPNGAGKSTTMKLLSGLIKPDAGTIKINGYDLITERESALEHMFAVIEIPGLYEQMTGWDNLNYIKRLRHVPKEWADEIVNDSGLETVLNRKVKTYSVGMKQRLALSMGLMVKPSLLILDEPTNGLDPTGTIEFREKIKNIVRQFGVAVLFSSHLLGEVEKIADRIIYIREGILMTDEKHIEKKVLYEIRVSDSQKAANILEEIDFIENISVVSNQVMLFETERNLAMVITMLIGERIEIFDIDKRKEDLETRYRDIFL